MSESGRIKNILFHATLVIFPFLLLGMVEIALKLFGYGDDLSLFVSSPIPGYYQINRKVAERFFSRSEITVPTPVSDYFLKEKPASGYRIFVLGESSVEGFPYDANLISTRILQRRLQDIFPDRTIEVVNLGMTAIDSYALLDFAKEILQQKPDAILIYAGHNEYYGALGVGSMENGSIPIWMKKLEMRLVHLRLYQLLGQGIASVARLIHPVTRTKAKETLMERMIGRDVIPFHSKMYYEGLRQFSDNIGELIIKMKDANVPVIISDLVSNVGHQPPFRSVQSGTYPDADSLYHDALRLEATSKFANAKKKFIEAKDLDAMRFRASEDMNSLIARLSDSLGVYHMSLKSLFENHSPNGIVGDNLMSDHLHPNIDGQFLIAEGFFNALKEHGMIEIDWDSSKIRPSSWYRNNWGFTTLDSMIAIIKIKHLKAGWPFQPENTVNNFRSVYTPHGIVDSLAFMTVEYVNFTPSMAHKKLASYYESI
ncbi:MAG TPA: hypothetical protein VEF33_13430, partial [Syntrophales bacterium]|nr:hypothetical protein [Syntrophales bacterium]